ncbi:MAG: HIT family protein [Steroidobacteraceae bacterium]
MSTAIHRRVEALREGRDPTFIARLPSGWAVFGDRQFLRGYCLLLPDPVVPHLNDFDALARSQFLSDMAALGDALLAETGAIRINYAMFGNLEPALHAHLVPRHANEKAPLDVAHPWAYDWAAAPAFEPEAFAALTAAIRRRLTPLLRSAGAKPSST